MNLGMKCEKCQSEFSMLTNYVDATTGKVRSICWDCEVARMPELLEINQADAMIEELEDQLERMRPLCAAIPDNQIPKELKNVMHTPKTTLHLIESLLENTRKDRNHILAAMPEKKRLKYEIARAVKKEDYRGAEKFLEQLKALP